MNEKVKVKKVKVDVFDLYNELRYIVVNTVDQPERRAVLDESFIEFSEEEVIGALRHQMEGHDVPAAIEECLALGWLRKNGEVFHFTDLGMDIYRESPSAE